MKQYHVYILECADESYYVGVTSNLKQRLFRHETGYYKNSYTSKRLPVKLLFYQEFKDIRIAIAYEKQIKRWSRAKKEALINKEFDLLPDLAKKKF